MKQPNFWNNTYNNYTDIWGTKKNEMVNFLLENLKSGQKVLDLGCGSGRDCLFLASDGICGIGIDISVSAIKTAQERLTELNGVYIKFICTDFDKFFEEYRGSCFDAIISINALNHAAASFPIVLDKIYNSLKSGGYLCLSLFACDDEEWLCYEKIDSNIYSGDFGQVKLFTRDEIEAYLKDYEIIKFWNISYMDEPHSGAPFVHKNSFWKIIARKLLER